MDLDEAIMRFRLASRELFNSHFHIKNGYENDGWSLEERFSEVEKVLFEKLVIEPMSLGALEYGERNDELLVCLRGTERAPIMINRDIAGGYWDFPVNEVTKNARLSFVRFFDWDQLAYRDNQYVRVVIDRWPSQAGTVGKHALIETQYVRFERAAPVRA